MGSYFWGIVVAACLVFCVVVVHETSTGNSLFGQNRVVSLSEDELRALAVDFSSDDQLEAILQLGDRPGDLRKTVVLLASLASVRNESFKKAVETSLETIGANGAVHLRDLVDERTTNGYRMSCSAMRSIGPASKMYLPEIIRLLEDENPLHRKCGLFALQGMGPAGKAAMKQIVACVLDQDLNNQCMACRILENFGTDAIDAEESLLELQKHGGPSTRGWAAICLGAIGPTSSGVDIAELLAEQLGQPSISSLEQERILKGLAHLGPEAIKVADVVRENMNASDKLVSGYAAYALWRITGKPEGSLSTIRNLLANQLTVDDGLSIVARMGPEGVVMVHDAARELRSHAQNTRRLAVVAIGNMGPAAKGYESRIRGRLKDTDPMVRMAARRALSDLAD